ncbi:hypothetical protein Tery_3028 [Trichodesmium erythraeum IMS101]|uniref:Uncharacterized protein n=1 Tax=Trichodesmium erythraeum (strain IMS101) TaxID=203124 RepID=Q10ZZ5_TRIEI
MNFANVVRQKLKKIILLVLWSLWNNLKKIANFLGKTIYQLKYQLSSKYLVSELKYPTIKMTVIEIFIDFLKPAKLGNGYNLLSDRSMNSIHYI